MGYLEASIQIHSMYSQCCHAGVKDLLKNLSEKQGKKMNSPESAKDIPKFLELFKVQSMTKPFFT